MTVLRSFLGPSLGQSGPRSEYIGSEKRKIVDDTSVHLREGDSSRDSVPLDHCHRHVDLVSLRCEMIKSQIKIRVKVKNIDRDLSG